MDTQSFNIVHKDILTEVKKRLSLIGKRAKTPDGKSLFSQITISSLEDNVLYGYILGGIQNIVDNTKGSFLSVQHQGSDIDNGKTSFTIAFGRWQQVDNNGFPLPQTLSLAMDNYLVNYVVAEYLTPLFPQMAQQFTENAVVRLERVKRMVYYKYEPEKSNLDYSAITGNVTTK